MSQFYDQFLFEFSLPVYLHQFILVALTSIEFVQRYSHLSCGSERLRYRKKEKEIQRLIMLIINKLLIY